DRPPKGDSMKLSIWMMSVLCVSAMTAGCAPANDSTGEVTSELRRRHHRDMAMPTYSPDLAEPMDLAVSTKVDAATAPKSSALFEQPEPWTKDVSALTADSRSSAIISALTASGGWGDGNKLQIDF